MIHGGEWSWSLHFGSCDAGITQKLMPVTTLCDRAPVQFLYWLHASQWGSVIAVIP
jgi:hypothetical protein